MFAELNPTAKKSFNSDFSEQYKSPKWQKKRLEILEHYEYECCLCTATEKTLHVHHRRYISGKKIWEYDNSQLICLCEDCHKKQHELKEKIEKLIFDDFFYSQEEIHKLLDNVLKARQITGQGHFYILKMFNEIMSTMTNEFTVENNTFPF